MTSPPSRTDSVRIGVLGSGQLGRMLALAGIPRGWEFRFFAEGSDEPVRGLGACFPGESVDSAVVDAFCANLTVTTFEFENIPVETLAEIERRVPVFPGREALETCRDRLREKALCEAVGIPTARYIPVLSDAAVEAAAAWPHYPALLKTARLGYDGKGQCAVSCPEEVRKAWESLGRVPSILEEQISFDREISVAVVRSQNGEIAVYPVTENVHREGILRVSRAPFSGAGNKAAQDYARRVAEHFQYVGVLTVECFERGGEVLVNEFAPRVHNSYHWTIEGAVTSQFENHLRAVAGLPLGDCSARGYAVMVNLIGTVPPAAKVLEIPGAYLHLYGKSPRPGRKLGHVTMVEATVEELERKYCLLTELYPQGPIPAAGDEPG